MSYPASLRQQAKWIREAIDDPAPSKSFRFDLGDVDTDELDAAADYIAMLEKIAAHVCWFDWSNNDSDAVAAIAALRTLVGSPTGERT